MRSSTRDRFARLRIKADADVADRLQGVNQFNVTVSHGIEGAGSTVNGNLMASRAVGRVDFSKVEGYASRLQPLVANFSALLSAYGQYAFTPLLTPEQCGYGGRFFGRAFDPSQFLADSCLEVSGELRYDIRRRNAAFSSAALCFLRLRQALDQRRWARHACERDGASAGAGVRLGWQHFSADLSAAKAIEGPRNDWRFFFMLAAHFRANVMDRFRTLLLRNHSRQSAGLSPSAANPLGAQVVGGSAHGFGSGNRVRHRHAAYQQRHHKLEYLHIGVGEKNQHRHAEFKFGAA